MFIAGANAFILRVAVEKYVDTTFLPLGMHCVVFACSVLAYLVVGGTIPPPSQMPLIILFGVLQGGFFALSVHLRLKAIEENAPAFIVFSLFQFKIIPVILLSFLFLDELSVFYDGLRIIGLILGIVAIALILEINKFPKTMDNPIWKGIILAGAGMLCSSLVSVINKNTLNQFRDLDLFFLMALVSGSTIIVSLIPVAFDTNESLPDISISRKGWLYGAIMGGMTFVAFLSFMSALKEGNLSQVAAINSLGVLVPIILASLFWGEKLTQRAEISMFLAVISLILIG
jgi:uncharacterized membrane protein